MKKFNEFIKEKLIINKDYKNASTPLLELAKKIWCAPLNIDVTPKKDNIKFNWLWVTDKGENINDKLFNFTDEIYDSINEYDHNKSLGYYKYGTDKYDKNKMLKEMITIINEENLADLLFQSNPRASKHNIQLIRVKDNNVLIYILGKSLFKKGKFDINDIGSFRVIILYND